MCKIGLGRMLGVMLVLTGGVAVALHADVITLSDIPGPEEPYISGVKAEADKDFSPASTFKMIIALAAFEEKIATPETELMCKDNVLPTQMPMKFGQAMQESNNDFFLQLIGRLTDEQLLAMAARCEFGTVKGKAPTDRHDWIHGGPIRVTPKQEHQFLRQLVRGKLPVDVAFQKELLSVMKWPAVQAGVDVYGKTGSWEHTYWFVGVAVKPSAVRVVTITLTAPGENRARAIQRFFQQIDRKIPAPGSEEGNTLSVPGTPAGP